MKKLGIAAIVIVALAAFSIIPVSAQGDPGAGCTAETKFYDTIHGDVYFEQQGFGYYNSMTKTFNNVPDGIKVARIYTGFWQGSLGKGGFFNITIQNATGSYTTDTYKACDPCPQATGCAPWQTARCDVLNDTINWDHNEYLDRVNMHDYDVGCGVQFVSFNATPYITPGSNTITVKTEPCSDCTRGGWDGRIYVIALLVVYENVSMPEITYWINEGAPYLEEGSDCDGPEDHLSASKYFNGTHVNNPTRVRLWSLGWPHVINADTKLNDNNIGDPDITQSYGGYEILLRWENIPTSYLDDTSNFLEYYDLNPVYERAFAEVLIVQGPSGKPDLTVTDINAYHNNTDCPAWFNLSNEIGVTVKNNGTTPAGASNASLYIDDEFFGKLPVSSLAAGASETVTFENWKPIGDDCLKTIDNVCYFNWSYKDYNFTAIADCDNDVAESNETNNETTVVERASYNGYMADEPLENVAHGTLHGHLIFTTGDGVYSSLYNYGDTQVTHYDITIPDNATVKLANLNVYYTWCKPKAGIEVACPEMEVSIDGQVLPLEKAYNDVKCTCPGASWVYPWGNYVYNVTDYIDGSGTYTVTVKNNCTEKCKYFCPAAPGIVLVYEDENAPLIEYWVNKGADVLIGGRGSDGGYLAWWECINNATFTASTGTRKVANATLGVVAPWGDDVPNDILFFNDVEIGRGVYNGYSTPYSKTIDSITMEVNSTNAQVGVNVTNVTALYLKGNDNVVGQADDGDNMMPSNAFLVVEYKYKMPDLVITNKSEALEDGTFTVTYTVANVGDGDAGESNTTIFIDGVPKMEDPVPALGAGESCTNTAGPFDCPCGATLNITVCADNENVVEECNEENNCLSNELVCPGIPDLVVEKSVTIEDGTFIVNYTVMNIGCGLAGESTTCKFVDGELKESQTCPALGSSESYHGTFGREPCPCGATLNVTVCADNYDEVDESDETNNCMENTVTCPVVEMPDLIVIGEDINAYHYDTDTSPWFNILNEIDVTVKNNGSVSAGKSNVGMYIEDVLFGKLSLPSLNPGDNHTVTFTGWKPSGSDCLLPPCVFDWSYCNYSLKGVADCDCDVAESNETNNEATAVKRVCYNGYMADEPLKNVAHGSFHGHLIFTTGGGSYGGLNSPGATRTTNYDITLPASATMKFAQLNVYYTWVSPDHACPKMEVSITNAEGTYVVPLRRAYNDIKCTCPKTMYVKSWGNYVFDIADYVTGSGTYTVTVKNVGSAGHKFKIAAPGITLVYEDESAPLIDYWVNNGADLLLGGRRGDGGYLSLEECINDATFPASTTTGEMATATLGVVAPWGDNAADDVLYFNAVELGRGVYNGYSSSYDETIDGITMIVGGSNAQVGVSVRSVTSQYHKGSGNIAGQADDGDNMMPANAFLVVGYEDQKPDLEILDKWERWVNETHYNVTYVILNNGSAPAPAGHNTTLYVDGVPIEHKQVPVNLAPRETYTDTFDTVIEGTDESDAIRVCADNYRIVDELDEDNNCLENVWTCLRKADLVIENKWEDWVNETHYNVIYVIHNTGTATAPAGHNTTLYVDGVPIEHKHVPVDLAPCETYTDTFDTVIECTDESDTIRVCADNYRIVDELDETNNCLENVWACLRAMPGISVNKVANPPDVAPSSNVEFTITVPNTGDCTLDPVRVVDTLSAWMSYVSSHPAADTHDGTIIWNNVGPLDPGASKTITLVARVASDASGTLTNAVTVTGTNLTTGINVTDSDTVTVLARTIEPPTQTLIDVTTEIKSDGTVIEGEQFGWETGNGNLLNNPPLSPGEVVGSIKYDDKMISSNGTTEFEKSFGVNTNVTPNIAVTKDIGYKSGDLGSLSYAEQVGMRCAGASPPLSSDTKCEDVNAYSKMVVTDVSAASETEVGITETDERDLHYGIDAEGKGSVSAGVDVSTSSMSYKDKSTAYGGNFSLHKTVDYTSRPSTSITTDLKGDSTVVEEGQFGCESGNDNLKYNDKMIGSNGTTEFEKYVDVSTSNLEVAKSIGYKSGDLGSLSHSEQVGMRYSGDEVNAYGKMVATNATTETEVEITERSLHYGIDAEGKGSVSAGVDAFVEGGRTDMMYEDESIAYGNFTFSKEIGYNKPP